MLSVDELPSFAIHWASELGQDPSTLERLHGGINNRVFRCGVGAQKWVIKGYPSLEIGRFDRMQAEQQFLHFANHVAPGLTPSLIHVDLDRRCMVLENIDGQHFPDNIPPPSEAVSAAVRFIQVLNHKPGLASEFIQTDAAEGFLSLTQHLINVQERLEVMGFDDVKTDDKALAKSLLYDLRYEFSRLWEQTHRLIEQGIVIDAIDPDERCVSPSDFGFHNAFSTKSGVKFFDFEFSGWDDPAKATLDFVLQPRVPVVGYGSPLLNAWHAELRHSIKKRCYYLAPILRLKWMCIFLSVLNPIRLREMLCVIPGGEAEGVRLVSNRLKDAKSYLDRSKETIIIHNSDIYEG